MRTSVTSGAAATASSCGPDPAHWAEAACQVAGRTTPAEWIVTSATSPSSYLPDVPLAGRGAGWGSPGRPLRAPVLSQQSARDDRHQRRQNIRRRSTALHDPAARSVRAAARSSPRARPRPSRVRPSAVSVCIACTPTLPKKPNSGGPQGRPRASVERRRGHGLHPRVKVTTCRSTRSCSSVAVVGAGSGVEVR